MLHTYDHALIALQGVVRAPTHLYGPPSPLSEKALQRIFNTCWREHHRSLGQLSLLGERYWSLVHAFGGRGDCLPVRLIYGKENPSLRIPYSSSLLGNMWSVLCTDKSDDGYKPHPGGVQMSLSRCTCQCTSARRYRGSHTRREASF